MTTNVQIPLSLLPDGVRKFAEQMTVFQSVKESKPSLQRQPQETASACRVSEAVILARSHVRMDDGSVLVEAWKP